MRGQDMKRTVPILAIVVMFAGGLHAANRYDDKLAELLKTRPNGIVGVIIQRTVPVNAAHAAEISNAGGRVVGGLDMSQAGVAVLAVSQLDRMAGNRAVEYI